MTPETLTVEEAGVQNAARAFLCISGDSVDEWEGICGELANSISQAGDDILYVEGDAVVVTGWRYHMVVLRDGLVHDAWCEGDALPPQEWLRKMFGTKLWVEVSVNGDTVFSGYARELNNAML